MSPLEVVHAGISPEDYNRRNYVDPTPQPTPQQVKDGLPPLPPVSKPMGLTATKPVRPTKVSSSTSAIADANQKDLKQRHITP